MALFDLTGRTVLVTGASRGIGHALALGLAEAGADVAVSARDEQALIHVGTGSIVNVASVAGLIASPMLAAYGASKAAVISLTKTLAHEWGPRRCSWPATPRRT